MSFAGLDVLTGVTVTDRQLGASSFGIVLEVEYNGQKYAGKKKKLLDSAPYRDIVDHFAEECRLLSQLDHPNIVQFVGVYFHQGERVPILVMELLHTDLNACIERHGNCNTRLPKDIAYSILHDVAQGLHYLHSQSPPIMHRNLTARDILLTSKMSAKICDFGSARSFDTTTRRLSGSLVPETALYMPQEACLDDSRYETSIDVFSYGIIMVFMFSGKFPVTLKESAPSEAKRREEYLQVIGNDHPAMKLIRQCIANDPQKRPTATVIAQQIKRIYKYDGKCSSSSYIQCITLVLSFVITTFPSFLTSSWLTEETVTVTRAISF